MPRARCRLLLFRLRALTATATTSSPSVGSEAGGESISDAVARTFKHLVVFIVIETGYLRTSGLGILGVILPLLQFSLLSTCIPLTQLGLCIHVAKPPTIEITASVEIRRLDTTCSCRTEHRAEPPLAAEQPQQYMHH